MCNKLNLHNGGKKWCSPNLALLILRISLGLIFVAHGLSKINNMEATLGFFASLGIPAFLTYLVAWVEFLAGIALILGVYSWISGVAIAVIMVFAIILVKSKGGNLMAAETDFMIFAAALTIAFIGPGKFSLMKGKKYCSLGSCSTSSCEEICGDKCCAGDDCSCGDCGSCEQTPSSCSHDAGCSCGDCATCK